MFDLYGTYEMTFASSKEAERYFPGCYQKINKAIKLNTLDRKKMMVAGKLWKAVPADLQRYAFTNCKVFRGTYVCLRCNLENLI